MFNLEIIGEGATTKIYRDGDKAIKLYVNAPPNEAENEAKLQNYAVQIGLPVPIVYGVRKIDKNTTSLDMEYIPGKPLMYEKMNKDERFAAIQTLVKLQCMVQAVNTEQFPKQNDRIKQKIEHNNFIENKLKKNCFYF